MAELEKSSAKLEVRPTEDVGKATKIVPLLDLVPTEYSSGILLFDDDIDYPTDWFDGLLQAFADHNGMCAVGRNGSLHRFNPFQYDTFNHSKSEKRFLSMKTAFGAIYPRSALPATSNAAMESIAKYKEYGSEQNDGMMLASWSHISKTSLLIIPTSKEQEQELNQLNTYLSDDVSLSRVPNHVGTQVKLASKMIGNGEFPTPWADIWTIVALIIGIIAIFFFLIFFSR
jgi:hypothetical protein